MRFDAKVKAAMAVFALVFVFVNLIIFLIPFPHGVAFWTAYAFLMIALIVQFVISYISTKKAFSEKNGIRYYPLMRIGAIYLTVQGIASLIFFLLDSYITLPLIWIPPVVCLVIFGVSCALLVSTYSGIKIVDRIEKKTKEDTAFIYGLTVEADILRKQADSELQKKLDSLYETIRYSDPVSSPELADVEQRIREQMEILKAAVTLNDAGKAEESILKLSNLMYERNQKCKLSK